MTTSVWMQKLNTTSLATQLIQIRSSMMVFFGLMVVLRNRSGIFFRSNSSSSKASKLAYVPSSTASICEQYHHSATHTSLTTHAGNTPSPRTERGSGLTPARTHMGQLPRIHQLGFEPNGYLLDSGGTKIIKQKVSCALLSLSLCCQSSVLFRMVLTPVGTTNLSLASPLRLC